MRKLLVVVASVGLFSLPAAIAAPEASACSRHFVLHQLLTRHKLPPKSRNFIDQLICADFTHDGRIDIAFTYDGGGSGGAIAWGILVPKGSRYNLALWITGTLLLIRRTGQDVQSATPVYARTDAHCCPSSWEIRRYHWQHGHFRVIQRFRRRSTRPGGGPVGWPLRTA